MKALKCKTLGVELALLGAYEHYVAVRSAHILLALCIHIVKYISGFTLTTIYLLLMPIGSGRQLNLPRGNFND